MKKVGLTKRGLRPAFLEQGRPGRRSRGPWPRLPVPRLRSGFAGHHRRARATRIRRGAVSCSPPSGWRARTQARVSVRKRIEALLDAYRERLLPFMPGQTREEKLVKCQLLFPSMAGG
jgi:hypothetical protein